MKTNEILLRLLLLKGPYWHRAYFLSLYCIFVGYVIVFLVFFHCLPGQAGQCHQGWIEHYLSQHAI